MSYETRYAARMMTKGKDALDSPQAVECRRLENMAIELASDDLVRKYPDGITPENARELLSYQRERIAARKYELGV